MGSVSPQVSLPQQSAEHVDSHRLLLAILTKQWTVFFNRVQGFLSQCCKIWWGAPRLLNYTQPLPAALAQQSAAAPTSVETSSFCFGHPTPRFCSPLGGVRAGELTVQHQEMRSSGAHGTEDAAASWKSHQPQGGSSIQRHKHQPQQLRILFWLR